MIQAADGEDAGQGWECLRCGEEVLRSERYSVQLPQQGQFDDEFEGNISGSSEYEFSSDLDMYTDMSGSMGSYSGSTLSE